MLTYLSRIRLVNNLIFKNVDLQGQNQNERDDLIARERKLQVQVEDLRETMRHQQEAFAHEKKELVGFSIVAKLLILLGPIFSHVLGLLRV